MSVRLSRQSLEQRCPKSQPVQGKEPISAAAAAAAKCLFGDTTGSYSDATIGYCDSTDNQVTQELIALYPSVIKCLKVAGVLDRWTVLG